MIRRGDGYEQQQILLRLRRLRQSINKQAKEREAFGDGVADRVTDEYFVDLSSPSFGNTGTSLSSYKLTSSISIIRSDDHGVNTGTKPCGPLDKGAPPDKTSIGQEWTLPALTMTLFLQLLSKIIAPSLKRRMEVQKWGALPRGPAIRTACRAVGLDTDLRLS